MAKQSSSGSGQRGPQRRNPQNASGSPDATRSRTAGSRNAPGRSSSGSPPRLASGHRRAGGQEEE